MSSTRKPCPPGVVQEVYRDPKTKKLYPVCRVDADGVFVLPCPFCGERHQHGAATRVPQDRGPHCLELATVRRTAIYTKKNGKTIQFTNWGGYHIALEKGARK